MMHVEAVASTDQGFREALLAAELPIDDLDAPGRQFFRFSDRTEAIGYGGLEPYGDVALLRSVVVAPAHRGAGKGRAIAESLLAKAADLGIRDVYLLTTTAETFFEHLGFRHVERPTAPPAILATQQAATICASAALLTKPTR